MSSELSKEQEKQVQKQINDAVLCSVSWMLKIMKEHFGEEVYEVVVKAESEAILSNMRKRAEEIGENSIEAFIKDQWEPLPEQGYEYTVEKTASGYQMNVTKCPVYDLAKQQESTEQLFYLCCEGDQFIPEGFNPNIGFKRTKTLMEGHECCDHFYYYKESEIIELT